MLYFPVRSSGVAGNIPMKLLHSAMVAVVVVAAQVAAAGPRVPPIPFEKYTLPNGLQVILHEDHATPIVTVNVWYHVGARASASLRSFDNIGGLRFCV